MMMMMMAKRRTHVGRRAAARGAVPLMLLFLLALAAVTSYAYDHQGTTVAGSLASGQDAQGVYGTSRINNPFALCADYNAMDASDTTFLIGSLSYMYTFNRFSTYLGFWFGQGTASTGAIASVRLQGIYGCATLPPSSGSTSTTSIVYFVQNDLYVYWVASGVVSRALIATGTNTLFDVSIYNNNVYIFTTQHLVYQCAVGTSGVLTAATCTTISLTGSSDFNNLAKPTFNVFKGFTVSAAGIFVAPTSSLYQFNLSGVYLASSSAVSTSLSFRDIKYTRNTDIASGGTPALVAATSSAVYSVSVSGSTISYTVIAGTETASCVPTNAASNVDSTTSPSFCGITRVFPITSDTVYLTLSDASLVRAITVGNSTAAADLPRNPYPVNFIDSATVMPLTLAGMDYELGNAANIPFPYAAIDESTPAVNNVTWDTTFTVDVSNRFYSTVSTAAITGTPYSGTQHGIQAYYNRTNFILFGDANVLPMCNLTKMHNIQRAIAADARSALLYPFIYTSNATNFTVNAQPNLTLVKLLMPYPFGTFINTSGFFANATTPIALAAVKFNTTMLAAVRYNYDSSRVYDQIFAGDNFPFNKLNAVQLQEVRWIIYQCILNQLAKCAAAHPAGSSDGGSGSSSDLVPGCTPRVGIDNVSDQPTAGQTYDNFNISVFIPETLDYNFNIHACLDGTNWTDPKKYIDNATAVNKRKCDTGCIVGIAVAAAVVAAVLVVVLVIVTSKRRRLATVVAPAATSEPKFTSTLDMHSDEGSRNPLVG